MLRQRREPGHPFATPLGACGPPCQEEDLITANCFGGEPEVARSHSGPHVAEEPEDGRRVGGAAALTYVSIDGDQSVEMGEDLIPGQFNRPIYFPPVRAVNHLNEWDLAPILEAGVRGSYDVTPTTQCFIRGDILQFSEVREAHDTVVFQLPSMGLRDPGGYDVTITAASIGIEVRR